MPKHWSSKCKTSVVSEESRIVSDAPSLVQKIRLKLLYISGNHTEWVEFCLFALL
jgi:hypothetical protein